MSDMRQPVTLVQIKEWRQRQSDEGQPSSFEDFFRLNDVCKRCRGDCGTMPKTGSVLTCERCGGDGKWHEGE